MNEEQQSIIEKIVQHVKNKFLGESSGHDWWHIYRVWHTAKTIAHEEKADMYVVELAALLHDIADWKEYEGDLTVGPKVAGELLSDLNVDQDVIKKVQEVISQVSFKGAGVDTTPTTLEAKVVQDADRLDALGAIGIARTFMYGGNKNRVMHDPDVKPVFHDTKESYNKTEGTTINHFYEKLLLLKELMNTSAGKKMAQERHSFMESFLEQFYAEWEGDR